MSALVQHVHHWEDTNLVLMSRVLGADAVAVVQADIASIALKVFDRSGTQITPTIVPVVADTVFDTLQTDARWTTDSTGYNFRYTLAGATYLLTGGEQYRIEVIATATAGGTYPLGVWEVRVENLRSS